MDMEDEDPSQNQGTRNGQKKKRFRKNKLKLVFDHDERKYVVSNSMHFVVL